MPPRQQPRAAAATFEASGAIVLLERWLTRKWSGPPAAWAACAQRGRGAAAFGVVTGGHTAVGAW